MLRGNKGEWSEVYAFFKILSEGNLYPGDATLNRIAGLFYPVIQILRKEQGNDKTFSISQPNIIVSDGANPPLAIPVSHFTTAASNLLSAIGASTGSAFTLPSTEAFLNSVGCYTIKANSTTKADIIIQIHDSRTSLQHVLGFSVKSQLGGASTLLNASAATNFTYKINGSGLTSAEISQINSIKSRSKIRDRIQAIILKGNTLDLHAVENKTFYNNLVLIDSLLPQILSNSLLAFFSGQGTQLTTASSLLTQNNPLNYDQSLSHNFYEHKLKRFLSEIALGMMPNKVWAGHYDGTEGYIVIKTSGEIVCYHIINRNLFEDYLLANTKFETPSSGRHGFGEIYTSGNELLFKLNLQIRFTA